MLCAAELDLRGKMQTSLTMRHSGSMFKKLVLPLVIAIITLLPAAGQEKKEAQEESKPQAEKKSPPTSALSEYGALLSRVKGGDLSIDFKQLRISWMESPERHAAKDTEKEEKSMLKAIQEKDYQKAIQNADVVLENEFVNLDAHRIEQIAYEELHKDEKSAFHKAVVQGLLRSIMDSGDGKSAKTAYVVISVHEEYIVLQVLGLRPSQQSVSHQDGHSYDVLEARKQGSDQTVKLYFNVDIPFKHYLN